MTVCSPVLRDDSNVLISHGSPQQLADALITKLSPRQDLRVTRTEFNENELEYVQFSLSKASISLNSLRNAFAPINSLPRETLAMIFSMVASDSDPATSRTSASFLPDALPPSADSSYAWVAVSHVCRYWRETAFAFPTLWTHIDTSAPLGALSSLDRAFTAPLRVSLRDAVSYSRVKPSLEQGRLLQTIAAHCDQFVELHVQPTYKYGPALLRFFNRPAPQLRSLSVALGVSQDQDKTVPLLFAGQTPMLRHLTLCNFSQWPESWNLGESLTHLCLYDQHIRARLPLREFLALLARCPRLEELIITEAGPSPIHPSPPTGGFTELALPSPLMVLEMPKLKLLHLGNWSAVRVVSEFLSHIVIPRSTKVEIWADVLFHGIDTLASLLPSDLSNFHPLQNLKAVHLMYRPTLKDAPQLFSVSDGVLVIHFYFIATTSGELLSSVFNMLDMRAVKELTIGVDCDPDFPAAWWRQTFASFVKLEKLNIVRRRSRSILSALGTNQDTHGHSRASSVSSSPSSPLIPLPPIPSSHSQPQSQTADKLPCPALTSLVITDDSALASIRLFALAQERSALGVPIQSLTITNATPGLSAPSLDNKLHEEMEDLRCHIQEVKFARNDARTMPTLPVGWPSEPFKWAMKRKETKPGWPLRTA